MLSPRRTWVVSTPYFPELLEQDKPFGYETVRSQEKSYTHLRFNNSSRPSSLANLFPQPYQIESKPWSKISTDLYYEVEGEFIIGENYWNGGTLNLSDNILTLKDKLQNKLKDYEVIDKIEKLICTENPSWDWSHEAHRATLLREHIPLHLKNKTTKIVKELDFLYRSHLSLTLDEVEQRFCIVINGDSGVHKTTLATKLIIPKLAAKKVIRSKTSYVMWEEQDLTDKLERLDNKEVVVLDDYSGENHKLGALNKLTSDSCVSSIRVMGDYQSTRYVKGVIIPTVDSVETWITNKTGTLRKIIQILRRTNCHIYIFSPKKVDPPTWQDYKDRLFYVGNVRQWIYDTIMKALPNLVDEPLWAYHKDTQLAKDLGVERKQAKRIGLGLFYGMGCELLAKTLQVSEGEAIRIRDTFNQKYAKTYQFIEEMTYKDEIKTPLLGRRVRFSEGMRSTKKFNWLIQSSCVDLLLVALDHVLSSNKVELRAHIHDSLYLACQCSGPHPGCNKAQEVVKELEELDPFFWAETNVRTLKFGAIEWTTTV